MIEEMIKIGGVLVLGLVYEIGGLLVLGLAYDSFKLVNYMFSLEFDKSRR